MTIKPVVDIERYKQGLTLMDDVFMSMCLHDNIPCTQVIVRIILGRDDIHVKRVQTQKAFKGFERSLTLDVLAEDDEGKLYNIEIQNADDGAEPRRARFHGSMIDAHSLKKGQKFKDLPECYVIFITRNDVLGFGKMIYHIERYISERNKRFNDGQHIIYVNCSAKKDDSELWKLIHDMLCPEPDEMFIPELSDRTGFFKRDEKGVGNMSGYLASIIAEQREEAAREAAREANLESAHNFASTLLKRGKDTLEEISSLTGLALQEVRRLADGRE